MGGKYTVGYSYIDENLNNTKLYRELYRGNNLIKALWYLLKEKNKLVTLEYRN